MEDSRIVELFRERDESALSAVSEKYGKYCAAIAQNILGDEQSAEECVQDMLLKLWETIPPKRPTELRPFVGRITRNIALNVLKARGAQKRGSGEGVLILDELSDMPSGQHSVDQLAEQHEMLNAINDFILSIPAKKRMILTLRYWHCCSTADISRVVGVSEMNVSNILKRERKKLIEYLKKRGY